MTTNYTITPLRFSAFSNREFESLMSDSRVVLAAFAKNYKSESMYVNHLAIFDGKLAELQAHLENIESKLEKTPTTADKERDEALIALFTLHKGFSKLNIPNIKTAYETLNPLFIKYKDIRKHGHDVATSEIKSLLKALKEDPYKTAVTTLNLTPVVTALTDAQSRYEKVAASKHAAKSGKELGKARSLRKELTITYDLFMRYTSASAQAYPEKVYYTKLLKDLNAIRETKRHMQKGNKRIKVTTVLEKTEIAG